MDQKVIKNKLRILGIPLIAILIGYLFSLTSFFASIELKTLDLRFRIRGEMPPPDSNIVIVAIDDQSFLSLDQKWPFPRSDFAHMIDNLSTAGARLIVLDMTLSESDLENPADDSLLAEAISQAGNVILAGKVVYEIGSHGIINRYLIQPISILENAALAWGTVNIPEDQDGFVRQYLLFQQQERIFYPLALQVVKEIDTLDLTQDVQNQPDDFQFGALSIPKFTPNTMLINYFGAAGSFPTYSFADVVDDSGFTLPNGEDTDVFEVYRTSGTFSGKIVFVGASAEELQDNKFTPFFHFGDSQQKTPGVEVHAHALQTILGQKFIQTAPFLPVFLFTILMIVVCTGVSRKLTVLKGLLFLVGELTFIFLIVGSFFLAFRIWVPLIFPISTTIVAYGGSVVYQVIMEQHEKGRYRKTFEHYVAQSVVKTMLEKGELPKFGGERKELTVLFSDIRSFTTFSEKYQPEVVVNQLSVYLTEMTDIIFKNNGTLDKFVGDEIMAIFGAPYFYENHALHACRTAIGMMQKLREIHHNWTRQNMAIFDIGIGINTGKVIVGNLGSAQLFDYTVIGDEVNLGARLEGANKMYSTSIIISDATFQQVKGYVAARELDNVRVKGKNKPVQIYELLGIGALADREHDLLIDTYSKGIEKYRNREWYEALKLFRRILKIFPQDGPTRLYIQRSLNFITTPPPPNWDGVFIFSTK
jgi:adenylate cyclase